MVISAAPLTLRLLDASEKCCRDVSVPEYLLSVLNGYSALMPYRCINNQFT